MKKITSLLTSLCFIGTFATSIVAQSATDQKIYDIIEAVSADRLEAYITTLANFGTRHTLSDTISDTRGIGAARRWIKVQFDQISAGCGDCLEVFYQNNLVEAEGNRRIPFDVNVVNVVAIQRGKTRPNDYIICPEILIHGFQIPIIIRTIPQVLMTMLPEWQVPLKQLGY